ncbi:MAG TPA: Na-translocating system protein MpsC family protein [Solirubrobacteraceae bacterium]|nr:Na-translocating system protein MpsC family protein [Solirubrobacteraceae bacterium]
MAANEQSPLVEISNAMVALYKEAFGRGPTKARARFVGDDTLLVTLESSLTVAERNLVAMGEHQRLREARLFLADALEGQFRAIVEQALGRQTLAYVSGLDTARDLTIKVFTLEPAGERSAPSAPETARCLRKRQ